MAHTTEHEWFNWVKINGKLASEFSLNALYAADMGVPSVFLSGDKGICDHAKDYYEDIVTVATKEGTGNSTWSLHPATSLKLIKEGVRKALSQIKPVAPLLKKNIRWIFISKNIRKQGWPPGIRERSFLKAIW